MGVMKFRLPSNETALQVADFRKAYVTGLDRTPSRIGVELRNGLMTCARDTMESGRLFVPWPIPGYGMPIIGTATLAERPVPYVLAVELARGKLNDMRNQLADWTLMGLRPTAELDQALGDAQHAFIRAATSTDRPDVSLAAAQASLQAAAPRRRPLDGCLYEPDPAEPALGVLPAANPSWVHVGCASSEAACPRSTGRRPSTPATSGSPGSRSLPPRASTPGTSSTLSWPGERASEWPSRLGPSSIFARGRLPDWIWLWQGDGETISGLVADFRPADRRALRGKGSRSGTWFIARPAARSWA